MRTEEEIADACIAVTAFCIFLLMYCCVSHWGSLKSCCSIMNDCICCKRCSSSRVESYDDLEELLFNAEEDAGGRFKDENGHEEDISVQNFFCDVLNQNPRETGGKVQQEESQEPLL